MKNINQNIFCNTPWYELNIYQDGRLGICCAEHHQLYDESENDRYNIKNMSISEWFNSKPVTDFRLAMLKNQKHSACTRCYHDEMFGYNSKRLDGFQKSAIFTQEAFIDSVEQSPGYSHFVYAAKNQGKTLTKPIDLHIDLGNHCNLACKMCNQEASSTIALQNYKWGNKDAKRFIGTDWTRDQDVWSKFKNELLQIENLNNIHFMGGETLISKQFEDFIDTMIENKRFDLCFSFVSNGTIFNPILLEKLSKFRRVGFEISIETIDEHNAYQRQGTNTESVLSNIQKYLSYCNGTSITVALRPAPSLLSVGYYVPLLQYALDNKLIVKSNLVYKPDFLSASVLPADIKKMYAKEYKKFLKELNDTNNNNQDFNPADPNNYRLSIKQQVLLVLNVLTSPAPANSEELLQELVAHCKKWDNVYNYNARELYPEFAEILDCYGY